MHASTEGQRRHKRPATTPVQFQRRWLVAGSAKKNAPYRSAACSRAFTRASRAARVSRGHCPMCSKSSYATLTRTARTTYSCTHPRSHPARAHNAATHWVALVSTNLICIHSPTLTLTRHLFRAGYDSFKVHHTGYNDHYNQTDLGEHSYCYCGPHYNQMIAGQPPPSPPKPPPSPFEPPSTPPVQSPGMPPPSPPFP